MLTYDWTKNGGQVKALDVIAKTFPGVVVYGECENHDKGHTIDIKFDWYPSGGAP